MAHSTELIRGCEQCAMFFALQVDRGNLSQALADNLLDDLGMNTNGTSEQPLFSFHGHAC
jgi:hypothetical protein